MVILWTACIARAIKYENLCLNDDRIFRFLESMNAVLHLEIFLIDITHVSFMFRNLLF